MALTADEYRYLDDKFGQVFAKMEKNKVDVITSVNVVKSETDSKVARLKTEVELLKAVGAHGAVEAHEAKHHNPARTWAILAAVTTVAGGIAAALKAAAAVAWKTVGGGNP